MRRRTEGESGMTKAELEKLFEAMKARKANESKQAADNVEPTRAYTTEAFPDAATTAQGSWGGTTVMAPMLSQDSTAATLAGSVATIVFVIAFVCCGWWFSPALFTAEDAQVYTLCMGIGFAPWVLQTLTCAPVVLILAFLGIEFGVSVASVCHELGFCDAPRRPEIEGSFFVLAVAALGWSLMTHCAVWLTVQEVADGVRSSVTSDAPLAQMTFISLIGYSVCSVPGLFVALAKLRAGESCKLKGYMVPFLLFLLSFAAAPYVVVMVFVALIVIVLVVLAIFIVKFLFLQSLFTSWHPFY